ncbi:helix-turn-helix transcriptional regulator [Pseudidiomarina gelatinasegens]|uniref:helix-turn-helix transcriptional regulator n=1 Tax=Pseudidiomarina gelatinasegens TaxID=2487740 RepID=UPI0030EBFDEF
MNDIFRAEQDELAIKMARLIRLEREYQMSQEALSERLFCSRASISRLETGHSVRSDYLLAAFAELGLARHFIELIDRLLAAPPAKRARDERQRKLDDLMAPYL